MYVLDEFHLEKYLTKLTSHMKDSRADALEELRTAIQKGTKKSLMRLQKDWKTALKMKRERNGLRRQKNILFQTGRRPS